MNRSLEFISRLISNVGVGATSVQSIRISNEAPSGSGGNFVRVEMGFSEEGVDSRFSTSLISMGLHVEDVIQLDVDGFKSVAASDIHNADFNNSIRVARIYFSKDPQITPDKLIALLKSDTVFGLPCALFNNLPAAKLKFYYGINRDPLSLSIGAHGAVYVVDGVPYVLEKTSTLYVEWYYIGSYGKLISKKVSIENYLSRRSVDKLSRLSLDPKVGLKIFGLFSDQQMSALAPFEDWADLTNVINTRVDEYVSEYTKCQVSRISDRVTGLQHRRNVSCRGIPLGKEPINEVETVLLFERLCHLKGFIFPDGLSAIILDYSPKDIDSICEIKLNKHSPTLVAPVEFEYSLKSFFDHGHDYRQVKLIICYKTPDNMFPYTVGGITYDLDESGEVPKLMNSIDDTRIPCLILNKFVT